MLIGYIFQIVKEGVLRHMNFYRSTWFFILVTVLFPPAAVFLLWKFRKASVSFKIVFTVFLASLTFLYSSVIFASVGKVYKDEEYKSYLIDQSKDSFSSSETVSGTDEGKISENVPDSDTDLPPEESSENTEEPDTDLSPEESTDEMTDSEPDVSSYDTADSGTESSPPNGSGYSGGIILLEPDPSGDIIFNRGQDVTIRIKGEANSKYSLSVYFRQKSSAKGLGDAVSDSEGYVSWNFKIGPKTSIGERFYFIIDGDDGTSEKFFFTVQ